jgi:predicted amidophosphoribosyltransferase
MVVDVLAALVDLVLPANCAGCDGPSSRLLCAACAGDLAAAVPHRVRPTPEPDGLPATVALAGYEGTFGTAIVGYKDRGRRGLVRPLGDRLADAVRACVSTRGPVLLVPVPGTAAAVRKRHGDHMTGLARRAAQALRRSGRPAAVANPVRALPRPDSTHLSATARAAAAATAFDTHPARMPAIRHAVAAGVTVVLVDDVMTTGVTLCAVARTLERSGIPVRHAAVLAATRRRAGSVRGTTPVMGRKVSYRT